MPEFHMRFPTNFDYDRLCNVTGSHNGKMHWQNVLTIVEISDGKFTGRGYHAAKWQWQVPDGMNSPNREPYNCFRPAFDCVTPKELPDDLKLGDVIVVGTLYVGGEPVCVPQEYNYCTVCKKNELRQNKRDAITNFELRPVLDDPDYAIWGIYVGNNTFIADRPLVKGISPYQIKKRHEHERSIHIMTTKRTPVGVLVAKPYGEPDYPGIAVYLRYADKDGLIHEPMIALVEYTASEFICGYDPMHPDEMARERAEVPAQRLSADGESVTPGIITRTWENISDEDSDHKRTIHYFE